MPPRGGGHETSEWRKELLGHGTVGHEGFGVYRPESVCEQCATSGDPQWIFFEEDWTVMEGVGMLKRWDTVMPHQDLACARTSHFSWWKSVGGRPLPTYFIA